MQMLWLSYTVFCNVFYPYWRISFDILISGVTSLLVFTERVIWRVEKWLLSYLEREGVK